MREPIVQLAFTELELAFRVRLVRFIEAKSFFVWQASFDRPLEVQDVISSRAFVIVNAADEFRDMTAAPNWLL